MNLNALKDEAQVQMRRLMSGTSPHSDEARLVGNQPLSFDLEHTNGVASTSGIGELTEDCSVEFATLHMFLTALKFKMLGVPSIWAR